MPIAVRYIEVGEGIGVEMIGEGHVTGAEICDALAASYSDEILPIQKYQIWYLSNVESFEFPEKDFQRMVSLDLRASQTNPSIIMAVVAEEDLIFGMSRMWEAHMEMKQAGFETMTFRNREDADQWISEKMNKA